MQNLLRVASLAALLLPAIVAAPQSVLAQPVANGSAVAVDEFNRQVNAYVSLRQREEASVAPLTQTPNAQEVVAREAALAARIRAARANAKQGELFVPAVVPVFKKIFEDYYRRRAGRGRRLMFDEVPNFTPRVGLVYPVTAPKATFPPRLALALPQLPEDLDYRLVGTSVVLRDTRANLIIDFIPNVLPASSNPGSPQ